MTTPWFDPETRTNVANTIIAGGWSFAVNVRREGAIAFSRGSYCNNRSIWVGAVMLAHVLPDLGGCCWVPSPGTRGQSRQHRGFRALHAAPGQGELGPGAGLSSVKGLDI